MIERIVQGADQILGQCGIKLAPVTLHELRVPSRLIDFDVHTAHTLITQQTAAKPTVYLTRDSKRETGFEGEAFGKGNSNNRPWLTHTVWLVAEVHLPALALAHELFHVVSNNGIHSNINDNLMNTRTRPTATKLTDAQCDDLRNNGRAEDLLSPAT